MAGNDQWIVSWDVSVRVAEDGSVRKLKPKSEVGAVLYLSSELLRETASLGECPTPRYSRRKMEVSSWYNKAFLLTIRNGLYQLVWRVSLRRPRRIPQRRFDRPGLLFAERIWKFCTSQWVARINLCQPKVGTLAPRTTRAPLAGK